MKLEKLIKELEKDKEKMIKIRRYLHENPEISFKETKTAEYISKYYENKGVEVKTHVGGNGIVVIIDSGKPGKTMGLRADFDALPIKEETGLAFSSKNIGVMHACGHDAHTAYLMVLADILIKYKKELKGKIYIIHQHAEEMTPGGAIGMIKSGNLDEVDNFFGIHVMTDMPLGKVYYHSGETQQGRSKFNVKLIGKGGHGSMPHTANDAIVAGANLIMALQTIVSRRLSPFENGVVTVGSFDGAGTFNIIKDKIEITGDVRAMSENTMKKIEEQINIISQGIAKTYSMDIEYNFLIDYPILNNDKKMTQLVVNAVKKVGLEAEDCGPQSPSEDFAHYAKIKPSCFFYVGAKKDNNNYPHHNSKFDINEESLLVASKAMLAVVFEYLEIN
ncbi:amidohydrolase [Sneathia sanguinegens]|uniref:Amidohydrolase n=1 Tax=Sneathia sanguinegens TaxID=40543 RepID=A0ABT7HJM8_9FUSO|nr:amidohydrolase [Sneathia sanguinegens]MDK9580713.1 amidohydrolase [Sneathia sanguinegens]